jgi:small basic protein
MKNVCRLIEYYLSEIYLAVAKRLVIVTPTPVPGQYRPVIAVAVALALAVAFAGLEQYCRPLVQS